MHSLFGPKLAYVFCKPVSLESVLSSLLVFPNMVQYLIKHVLLKPCFGIRVFSLPCTQNEGKQSAINFYSMTEDYY